MKKRGAIDTIIKAGIAAAAIGGTLYLLKDKIEENPKCKEAIDKVKETVKNHVPSKEKPVEEDDFFDEDFDEIIHTSSDRGYVNIKLSNEEEEMMEEPAETETTETESVETEPVETESAETESVETEPAEA